MKFFGLAAIVIALFSCKPSGQSTSDSSGSVSAASAPGALAARGRVIYQTNCIACHNTDPKKAGAVGPEIFGSQLDLIEARVMRAAYPPGYTPKRKTTTMAPLTHLKADLNAIHAYLNSNQ